MASATAMSPQLERQASALRQVVRFFAGQGLCPGTGGNFSIRLEQGHVLITASGVDKRELALTDLLEIDLDGTPRSAARPSAETGLHLALYRSNADIGSILHVHSRANTVLSRTGEPHALIFQGYEMQKCITGQQDHLGELSLPVIDNSQDMDELAAQAAARVDETRISQAFLVRGHGIYAWGADLASARRHLEGWEFLLDCELTRRQLRQHHAK